MSRIDTIVDLSVMFLLLFFSINLAIEIVEDQAHPTVLADNRQFIDYVKGEFNGNELDSSSETFIDKMGQFIQNTRNRFEDPTIVNAFFGVLSVAWNFIVLFIGLVVSIILIPSKIIGVLLYGIEFVANFGIFVNSIISLIFYTYIANIIFKNQIGGSR